MTDQASECILNRVLVEHTVHRFALKMAFSYLSDSEKRAVATDLSYASGPALQELFLSLAADHEIGIEVTSLSHGSDELHERALALGDECMIAAFSPETPHRRSTRKLPHSTAWSLTDIIPQICTQKA